MKRKTVIIIAVIAAIAIAGFFLIPKKVLGQGTGTGTSQTLDEIKQRILNDASWKASVEAKAKKAGRSFEKQLEMEAKYVQDNY